MSGRGPASPTPGSPVTRAGPAGAKHRRRSRYREANAKEATRDDLEGKPVAGAKVQINQLSIPNQGDLTAFLDDLKRRTDGYPAENNCLTTAHNPALFHLVTEVVSD